MIKLKSVFVVLGIAVLLTYISVQSAVAELRTLSKTDSLLHQLSRSNPDSNRANILHVLSYAYTDLYTGAGATGDMANIARALYYARQELLFAKKIKWEKGIANAYESFSNIYLQTRQYERALAAADQAYRLTNDASIKFQALEWKSEVWQRKEMFDESLKVHMQAIPLVKSLRKPGTLSRLYHDIAEDYLAKGDVKNTLQYAIKGLHIFSDNNHSITHLSALNYASWVYWILGDLPHSLDLTQKALLLINPQTSNELKMELYDRQGDIYLTMQDYSEAVAAHRQALRYAEKDKVSTYHIINRLSMLIKLAGDYIQMHDYRQARLFDSEIIKLYEKTGKLGEVYHSSVLRNEAEIFYGEKNYLQALKTIKDADKIEKDFKRRKIVTFIGGADISVQPLLIGKIYLNAPGSVLKKEGVNLEHRYRQAEQIFLQNLKNAVRNSKISLQKDIYDYLTQLYERTGDIRQAYAFYKHYIFLKDSIQRLNNLSAVTRQALAFKYMQREDTFRYQRQLDALRFKQQKKYLLLGIVMLLIISFFIVLNYISQRKANKKITRINEQLNEKHAELAMQRDQLEKILNNLRTTQNQLIQSEKMASLGELTAGIAHEIQNPLNFVNNFSEVSIELLQELKEEIQAGNPEEAVAIADDLTQNLEKVRHHGRRADGIVKGMLQHSRASSNQKEPANINTLADEYLRLAYHGLCAKDKSFNAELITNFDDGLPGINVVPQDIGRVLLNLFTNAFYAVQQKGKTAGPDYKPTVEVNTATENNNLVISVKDNGIGIPEHIKDKIMQPFFTTKPTGEGTGLGLSLSYDIVVKGHGGEIDVQSSSGQSTKFIIKLPLRC